MGTNKLLTMAAPDERFDSMLLGMAQTCGGIEPILHTFLAFLARRTDFFHIQDESNPNTGFPPGVAKKMLLKHFNHFEGMSQGKAGRCRCCSCEAGCTRCC